MKKILINDEGLQTRVAITEGKKLQDFFVERKETQRLSGSIYKGIIRNLEPSLQAAFVDIGTTKNAFLHYWDMIPATQENFENETEYLDSIDVEEEPVVLESKPKSFWRKWLDQIANFISPEVSFTQQQSPAKPNKKKNKSPKRPKNCKPEDIPNLFKVGDEIIVQITKEPIGTKGARVTTNISLPGRELVLLPGASLVGISKRIEDKEERKRLKHILDQLNRPNDTGIICRTVGAGKNEQEFKRDMLCLFKTWQRAKEVAKNTPAPCCIYEEPALVECCLRDYLTEDVSEIVTDNKNIMQTLANIVKQQDNKTVKIKHHDQSVPLFQAYQLNREIESIFNRKIQLPSGGYLCIDETEALIAIDVNTGKNRTGKDLPETIVNTNMEAVKEIARQLRLRNVGGIVVLDLIDMNSKASQQTVLKALKQELLSDRAKTKVYPISQLGLIEMTRQREHDSLQNKLYESCPYCQGKGRILSDVSISVEIQRKLRELLGQNYTNLRVIAHPNVLERLRMEDAKLLEIIEKDFKGTLTFRENEDHHIEEYKIINSDTGQTIFTSN